MKWKLLSGVLLAGLLAGCAMPNTTVTSALTPAQQAQELANQQTAQYQECLVYNAYQPKIAEKIKTIPLDQATSLLDASQQATQYCGTVFTNTSQQAADLASALTTITLDTGINFAITAGATK